MEKKESIIEATSSISSMVAKINEMCCSSVLWDSSIKPPLNALDMAVGRIPITEITAARSKWGIETTRPITASITALTKNITEPQLSVLAALTFSPQ